jgi:hypothetical protein
MRRISRSSSTRCSDRSQQRDGFDDAKMRTVSENATTLKFDQSGFEVE